MSIIDGVVHGINLSTLGVDSQQRDYELLVAKFGKPGLKRLVSKQNRMGATFEIIEAAWERPDGITILFQGAGSSLDAGTVKVQTTREAARLKELREQANVGKPKL
ncbi:hypothetical protein [Cupriavidus taiwanensis]|uniref:hypothetical protein n=1 Tax=Cupriavidus taiwanensis TaxID=164546 RepID=UPI0011AEB8A6|nr:hypothetical protein [Cupriavidus taiwanensis]